MFDAVECCCSVPASGKRSIPTYRFVVNTYQVPGAWYLIYQSRKTRRAKFTEGHASYTGTQQQRTLKIRNRTRAVSTAFAAHSICAPDLPKSGGLRHELVQVEAGVGPVAGMVEAGRYGVEEAVAIAGHLSEIEAKMEMETVWVCVRWCVCAGDDNAEKKERGACKRGVGCSASVRVPTVLGGGGEKI